MTSRRPLTAAALALLLLAGACSDDDAPDDGAATTSTEAPAFSGEVTVFAAASLTEAFTELGARFEDEHPGTTVTFNFGSSSALAEQVVQGAPVDVFASADEANMEKLDAAALVADDTEVFARNELAILVEDGNPEDIDGLADLASPDLAVVLCAAQVPCGKYAAQVLADAGVAVTPKSLEENVKGVVTKVTTGEADAGIVYVTDALAADDDADQVDIPADQNAVAAYPIASLADAPNPEVAAAFVDFVTGPEGQKILIDYGFTAP